MFSHRLWGMSALFASSLVSTGCATMFRGTSEQISINTDPSGATATLSDGRSCTTPRSVIRHFQIA